MGVDLGYCQILEARYPSVPVESAVPDVAGRYKLRNGLIVQWLNVICADFPSSALAPWELKRGSVEVASRGIGAARSVPGRQLVLGADADRDGEARLSVAVW